MNKQQNKRFLGFQTSICYYFLFSIIKRENSLQLATNELGI